MTKFILRVFLSYILLINPLHAVANEVTIDDLIAQEQVKLSLTLPTTDQQIAGQAYVLSIQVGTLRWFASGSQVQSFALPNVIMQANNIMTINGSERINGETWATQTHEITLYPTAAGLYQLPPISIDVSVNTEIEGVVSIISGIITTEPTEFEITLPNELKTIKEFIVSSEVTLEVDGEFSKDKKYAIGEALTQTITISASDLPAMMIPELTLKLEDLTGVSVYHKPAQIIDQSNRGVSTGKRIESFTYIFEKPGSYLIEEQKIYWWNSQSNTLETLVIPSSHWTVASGGLIKGDSVNSIVSELILSKSTVVTLLSLILLAIILYIIFIKRNVISSAYKKMTKQQQRQLRRNLLTHIANKNYIAAEQSLFQYALYIDKQSTVQQSQFAHHLNALAFGVTNLSQTKQQISDSISAADTKQFLKHLTDDTQVTLNSEIFPPGQTINLNSK